MNDPRLTGRSVLTGKMVYIRHATGWDLDTLRSSMKGSGKDLGSLTADQVVVAVEEDRIIGFGIVERTADDGAVCLTLSEAQRRRGIGSSIVRHLLESEPGITTLYVAGGRPGYFTRAGFSRRRSGERGKQAQVRVCPIFSRSRMAAARFERTTKRTRRG
jgi:N-acetylglutamate synthase-like GNAT family acetyltransferase